VDWEKVEAIMVVLAGNLDRRRRFEVGGVFGGEPFQGCWPGSYIAPSQVEREKCEHCSQCEHHLAYRGGENEENDSETEQEKREQEERDAKDPFGVSGTWLRVVSFMDWTDLHSYNFPHAVLPYRFHKAQIFDRQETRLIVMSVKVARVEGSLEAGNGSPVVHFKGTSRSLLEALDLNAHSEIKGEFIAAEFLPGSKGPAGNRKMKAAGGGGSRRWNQGANFYEIKALCG
jgi:hypothetical protein